MGWKKRLCRDDKGGMERGICSQRLKTLMGIPLLWIVFGSKEMFGDAKVRTASDNQ